MSQEVTEISKFEKGTRESYVKSRQQARLANKAKSCIYTGSESEGFVMTTVWNVPD